jgi:hypothetical protein
MVRDVIHCICACPIFQDKKTYLKSNELLIPTTIPISAPFAKVGLYLIGPLKTSADGHRFVIVATDYCISGLR